MSSLGSPSPFFLAGKKAYEVERSLRFNDGDSPNLARTPSGDSNKKKWTWSSWIKISASGTLQTLFSVRSGTRQSTIFLKANGQLQYFSEDSGGTTQANLKTNSLFRDPSAWYHVVVYLDAANTTGKIYVNGVEQSVDIATAVVNTDHNFNTTLEHLIGNEPTQSNYFDGYMAEVNFIDGQAYDPSYFGETDATTGQWNPKKYVGSYGTNGFYLNFSDNSGTTATTLGKDSSGNGNNFTPNNLATSDAVKDSPTNNFSTLNPLDRTVWLGNIDIATLSEGNLKASGANNKAFSSIGIEKNDTNKYYAEMYVNSNDSNNYSVLIVSQQSASVFEVGYVGPQGTKQINRGAATSYGATFDAGDVIGVLVDRANNQITFYKNGVSQGAISNTFSTTSPNDIAYIGAYYYGNVQTFNFGQDSTFAGAVSSGGNTDANGIGDFKYAVPTGAKALCSANLPDPTILLPNKHFDTTLYTGNNSSQEISTLNFQPDWLWFKNRGGTSWHGLFDSVRGRGQGLASNNSNTEYTSSASNDLVSFDDDGFTLGANQNWGSVNGSGNSIVTWAWNGGGADAKTYKVKVVADSTDYGHGIGANKYQFFKSDGSTGFGTNAVDLNLEEGGTYIFDWSDSSAQTHPIRFSLTNDGTHSSGTSAGTEYTTGVVKDDSAYKTTITIASGVANLFYYCQNHSGMGAEINTNTTKGSTNFDGSILSVAKANTTAGFSITAYSGNGSNAQTVGHGLGVAPDVIILKSRTAGSNWRVWHKSLATDGSKRLILDSTNASEDASFLNDTAPTSTIFTLGNSDNAWNASGGTYISYLFSEVAGYSKFGSFVGNGDNDGPFIFLGFSPALIIYKNVDSSQDWIMFDPKRIHSGTQLDYLEPNTSDSEGYLAVDILSNGFKLTHETSTKFNRNGNTFIYLAFAESPFKNARAR